MDEDEQDHLKLKIDPSLYAKAKMPGIRNLKARIKREISSTEPPTAGRRVIESTVGSAAAAGIGAIAGAILSKFL